jgi:hypothetical protein
MAELAGIFLNFEKNLNRLPAANEKTNREEMENK